MRNYLTGLIVLLCTGLQAQYLTNTNYTNTFGDLSTGDGVNHLKTIKSGDYFYHVGYTDGMVDGTSMLVRKEHIDGTLTWEQTYGPMGSIQDYGADILVDGSGNVYATGALETLTEGYNAAVVKYSSTGVEQWAYSFNSSGMTDDFPASLDVDGSGNVYVTGRTGTSGNYDAMVFKVTSNGNAGWNQSYDYDGKDDGGFLIEYTSASNLSILAITEGDSYQKELSKLVFDNNGTLQQTYRTNLVFSDAGIGDVEVLSTGDYLVCGWKSVGGGDRDILVYKFSNVLNTTWAYTYDHNSLEDAATALDVDGSGNIYFTGSVESNSEEQLIMLGKLNSSGVQQWIASYDYDVHFNMVGRCIDVDDDDILISGSITQNDLQTDLVSLYCNGTNGSLNWRKEWDNDNGNENAMNCFILDDLEFAITGVSHNDENFALKYSLFYEEEDVVDGGASGDYIDQQVVISFKENAINSTTFIDNKDLKFGQLSDVLSASDISALQSDFTGIADLSKTTISKVYGRMTSLDTIIITHDGDTIPMPKIWTTLCLHFEDSVNEDTILVYADSLSSSLINYTFRNIVMNNVSDWTPGDPQFGSNQSGFQERNSQNKGSANIEKAWDIEKGSESIRVGIYDTGVRWSHEDFQTSNGTGMLGTKIKGGYDYVRDVDINKSNIDPGTRGGLNTGHGTIVTGLIAAQSNNSKNGVYIGVAGVAGGDGTNSSGAQVYFYRTNGETSASSATMKEVAEAVAWSYHPNGPKLHVQNHSWSNYNYGTSFATNGLEELRRNMFTAVAAGVVIVTSAGNGGIETAGWPSGFFDPGLIRVGNSNIDGERHSSSHYGHDLDVMAPGTEDQHTYTIATGGYYNDLTDNEEISATSYSAPVVTGIAALMVSNWEKTGAIPNAKGAKALYAEDVEWLIGQSAVDLAYSSTVGQGYDIETGWGLVDAYKALQLIDRPNFIIEHYSTTVSLNKSDVPLVDNDKLTMAGYSDGLINFSKYKVSVYPVSGTLKTPVPSGYTLVKTTSPQLNGLSLQENGYWLNHSRSQLWGYDDATDQFWAHDGMHFTSEPSLITEQGIDYLTATIKGHVVYVKKKAWSLTNNVDAWFPFDPDKRDFTLTYSGYFVDKTLSQPPFGEENTGLVVYPNPSDGNITIRSYFKEKPAFRLYNSQGQEMDVAFNESHLNHYQIDLSHLQSGVYILKTEVSATTTTKKIVKQ